MSNTETQPKQFLERIFGGITDGELQRKFETFVNSHDVIDWNIVQESHSMSYSIFVRWEWNEERAKAEREKALVSGNSPV